MHVEYYYGYSVDELDELVYAFDWSQVSWPSPSILVYHDREDGHIEVYTQDEFCLEGVELGF